MRTLTLALVTCLAGTGSAIAQDASPPQDAPIETKSQTANSAPQTVRETAASKEHEQNEHWNDPMNTTHSRDPRKKDEYGSPVPSTPKGQGTNSSTDAQRAVDAKQH